MPSAGATVTLTSGAAAHSLRRSTVASAYGVSTYRDSPFALTSTSDAGSAAAAAFAANVPKAAAPPEARVARNTPPAEAATNSDSPLGDSAKPAAPPPGVLSAATAAHVRPAAAVGSAGAAAYTVAVAPSGAPDTSTNSVPPATLHAEGCDAAGQPPEAVERSVAANAEALEGE